MKTLFMYIIIICVAVALIVGGMLWERMKTPRDVAFVRIRDTVIPVEIRANPEGRMWGLSWRESLPKNTGMLFLFPKKDRYTFWMKDMKFPLDFIWISDGRVADMTSSVPIVPLTTFQPRVSVDAVLEVDAGFAEAHFIQTGDPVEMVFDKNVKIE